MTARRFALPLLAVLVLVPHLAAAKPHGDRASRHHHAASDSTRLVPSWMHPWFEVGGGWLASPRFMRGPYESGQALGAGVSARPLHRLELRTAFDYQTLQTNSRNVAYLPYGRPGGGTAVDTINYQSVGRAWTLTARPELGVMVLPDIWLTGGMGGGYMYGGGFENGVSSPISGPASLPPAMHNGWGWLWTAAVRYDFQPDPALPLGFDVRMSGIRRGPDVVRTWSVRVTYRMSRARTN